VVTQFLAEIEPSLSSIRLQRYQSTTGDDLETAVNYLWNVQLAEALYCSLGAVEIALRNALHQTLTQHFGTPTWYNQKGLLEPNQVRTVRRAEDRIQGYGDPVTPERVVSQLTFDFWVTILSRNYSVRLWQGQNAAPLKNAFMRIPKKKRRRQAIHQRYNEIRELRNRAFHHDPLFDDASLRQRHARVKQGLHWLNPRMVDWVEWYDRFPDVYANGRALVEAKLKAELGILP
jgi:hypothetical protein